MIHIDDDLLIKAKANSIGVNKKEVLKTKEKNIMQKTLIGLVAIALSLSMCACTTNSSTEKRIEDYNITYTYVDVYTFDTVEYLEKKFEEYNIDFSYPINNTVEDYSKVNEFLSEEDIIIYYDKFGKEECDKILKTFGYNDINDYLVKQGYIDSEGQPSIKDLRFSTYERITREMKEKGK